MEEVIQVLKKHPQESFPGEYLADFKKSQSARTEWMRQDDVRGLRRGISVRSFVRNAFLVKIRIV